VRSKAPRADPRPFVKPLAARPTALADRSVVTTKRRCAESARSERGEHAKRPGFGNRASEDRRRQAKLFHDTHGRHVVDDTAPGRRSADGEPQERGGFRGGDGASPAMACTNVRNGVATPGEPKPGRACSTARICRHMAMHGAVIAHFEQSFDDRSGQQGVDDWSPDAIASCIAMPSCVAMAAPPPIPPWAAAATGANRIPAMARL
jgi:hypothetical protein